MLNLNEFFKEQDLEVCAVKLQFPSSNICILSTYTAPSGNFLHFLNGLDAILKSLYNSNLEFIICGDINVNYLVDNRKKQLDTLLSSFNLSRTVYFPTRIQNNSISAIDNIFIDPNRSGNYTIILHVNDLSDHDGQIIYINNTNLQIHSSCTQLVTKFSKSSMDKFLIQLSYETWGNIFVDQDAETIFNSFLNIYLRIFYSNFLKKKNRFSLKLNIIHE
jgi:hypothetical protein